MGEVQQKSLFWTENARDFKFGVYDNQYQKKEKNAKISLICIFNWRPSWILGVGFQKGKGTQPYKLQTSFLF